MSEKRIIDEQGQPVAADDPNRAIWYGPQVCGFWTDDWNVLSSGVGNIPCCPECGAPGFITTAGKWFDGAHQYESQDHPGYVRWLDLAKGHCFAPIGSTANYIAWRSSMGSDLEAFSDSEPDE